MSSTAWALALGLVGFITGLTSLIVVLVFKRRTEEAIDAAAEEASGLVDEVEALRVKLLPIIEGDDVPIDDTDGP